MFKTITATALVFLALSGCAQPSATSGAQRETSLNDFGPAPELSNETWLNADQALRLENLRGKVVLLDMWTFG